MENTMNIAIRTAIILLSLTIYGCGGGTKVVHDSTPGADFTPHLYAFDILDSYDTDTAYSDAPLALNPYLYHGLFNIYWEVDSLEDYYVELSVNDYSDLTDSILVHSERCGAGLFCDQSGSWMCEYGADLTLSCNDGVEVTDISLLFNQVPQDLYLILQICDVDSSYCEYDYYPVLME